MFRGNSSQKQNKSPKKNLLQIVLEKIIKNLYKKKIKINKNKKRLILKSQQIKVLQKETQENIIQIGRKFQITHTEY